MVTTFLRAHVKAVVAVVLVLGLFNGFVVGYLVSETHFRGEVTELHSQLEREQANRARTHLR